MVWSHIAIRCSCVSAKCKRAHMYFTPAQLLGISLTFAFHPHPTCTMFSKLLRSAVRPAALFAASSRMTSASIKTVATGSVMTAGALLAFTAASSTSPILAAAESVDYKAVRKVNCSGFAVFMLILMRCAGDSGRSTPARWAISHEFIRCSVGQVETRGVYVIVRGMRRRAAMICHLRVQCYGCVWRILLLCESVFAKSCDYCERAFAQSCCMQVLCRAAGPGSWVGYQ